VFPISLCLLEGAEGFDTRNLKNFAMGADAQVVGSMIKTALGAEIARKVRSISTRNPQFLHEDIDMHVVKIGILDQAKALCKGTHSHGRIVRASKELLEVCSIKYLCVDKCTTLIACKRP
jgi:hypothetical protein